MAGMLDNSWGESGRRLGGVGRARWHPRMVGRRLKWVGQRWEGLGGTLGWPDRGWNG